MASPFYYFELFERVTSIEGFKSLVMGKYYLRGSYLTDYAKDVMYDYEDWPEDQGFGSSDFTYALKSFVDNIIRGEKLPLKTEFSPSLKVVEI